MIAGLVRALGPALLDTALVVLFFAPLERLFGRRTRPLFASTRRVDWLHALVTPWLAFALLLGAGALLGETLRAHVPLRLHDLVAAAPRPAAVLLAIVLAELASWATHWAMHRSSFLWRFHAVHHAAEDLDFLAGMRRHPVDTLLSAAALALPGFLLGVPLEGIAGYALLVRLWTIFLHADVDVRLGPLERLVTTPFFHHAHHARDETRPRNLANVLALLDVLFGTHVTRADWPEAYGTADPIAATWLGQLLLLRPRAPSAARPEACSRREA